MPAPGNKGSEYRSTNQSNEWLTGQNSSFYARSLGAMSGLRASVRGMSESHTNRAMKPPPPRPQKVPLSKEETVPAFTSDQLIVAGILEEIPTGYTPDQFCMAVSTQILSGVADLGATLLRVNARGQWEMMGGFLELFEVGEKLHQQRSTAFPSLMEALREGHSRETLGSDSCKMLGLDLDGHLFVAGLSRRGFGVLILGSTTPIDFSPTALKLLVAVTEMWLGRGDQYATHTASIPQVNTGNSGVIFTERQMQVLDLLADGKTNTEIGRTLSISASLAKQEVAFLSHALQAKNRLDVVVQAQRQGILPVGTERAAS